ncbi:outer membrane lipoprotein-sorting protein [Endozoicomonas numazuensis]|uniref:outer membrane lipoprotein-sorting protein n=1 Tax=Endozoicomonas numazuensis TaxID=1137799 RepID=UPI000554ABA1|nr:outer membrane lipoprotein-sorting protein [Endozoicomonas numazuensis]
MKNWFAILLITLANAALADTESSQQQDAVDAGYRIAQKADNRNTGWVDLVADLKMELINSHGSRSQRELRVSMLEVVDTEAGDKSLVRFQTPANVKGTVLLTHAYATRSDSQWQYFPSLKRVKIISSANKFSWILDKYRYKLLGKEEMDGQAAFKLEMAPNYPKSGYTRLIIWLDQENYYPVKTEFYDRKNELLKTQTYSDYRSYISGRFWRAGKMKMVNHLTGKTTLLEWNDYQLNTALNSLSFEKGSLSSL